MKPSLQVQMGQYPQGMNGSFRTSGPQQERTQVSFFFLVGGILVNTLEDPTSSKITTEEEIEFYVQQFKKSGFR